jgi:hypothetical protein
MAAYLIQYKLIQIFEHLYNQLYFQLEYYLGFHHYSNQFLKFPLFPHFNLKTLFSMVIFIDYFSCYLHVINFNLMLTYY